MPVIKPQSTHGLNSKDGSPQVTTSSDMRESIPVELCDVLPQRYARRGATGLELSSQRVHALLASCRKHSSGCTHALGARCCETAKIHASGPALASAKPLQCAGFRSKLYQQHKITIRHSNTIFGPGPAPPCRCWISAIVNLQPTYQGPPPRTHLHTISSL